MGKKVSPSKNRFYKNLVKFFSVLLCFAVLVAPTILILDETGVISLTEGVNRSYTISFFSDNDELLFEKQCLRGETINYSDVPTPKKNGTIYKYYSFIGWDTDNDGRSNILPEKVYGNLVAIAVFMEVSR